MIYESYIPADNSARDPNAPIVLRKEQGDAVRLAKAHFKQKGVKQFLWNAKMRFGKTLSALQLAKELGYKRTLIVTHRPVVETNFREDFEKIFKDDRSQWDYASRFDDDDTGSIDALEKKLADNPDHHYVFFASMQYLRRSSLVNPRPGADDNPLKVQILQMDWDMVVVDEAHEGTETSLGKNVIEMLRKPATEERDGTKMLHLSGTPYKLYNQFSEKEIYTWDYTMEQKAKHDWKPSGIFDTENPYITLPKMKIFTYDLSKLSGSEKVKAGATFTLGEFFSVWKLRGDGSTDPKMPEGMLGHFKHEDAVNNFLDLLCTTDNDSNYPFSTEEYQENFHHTLWVVPGVAEAKALSKLLKKHDVFSAFEIINVAGDGDEDEQRADALDKVKAAIGEAPDQTYTITISCGRLTTGVTVPPWTAVFYLKGADSTGASTYMQTIFRVQSAHVYNGMMKAECYVFDFAPDRSLKAVVDAARFAAKARAQKDKNATRSDEKEELESFLSFCPVISLDGGQMVPFDADKLTEHVNHANFDRIARNGFNDNALYDMDYILDHMTDEELDLIGGLESVDDAGKRNKPTKGNKPTKMANNGLTPEQRKKGDAAAKKDEKDRTPEEQAAYEARQEELRQRREEKKKRLAKLRGIAVRVPLLIFGGRFNDDDSDEISLNNFTRKIDDASWQEFMGSIRVSKDDFNKLKSCFKSLNFEGAGRRYRQWTREADSMHVEDRIKAITDIHDMFANPDKETVLTPWRVVNMHLSDCLGGYCFQNEEFTGQNEKPVYETDGALFDYVPTNQPRFVDRGDVTRTVFSPGDPATEGGTRILEINSKTGLYPLYATYSIYAQRKKAYIEAGLIANPKDLTVEEEQVIWDDVLQQNIYVITNTSMAEAITRRTLYGFREVERTHIKNDQIVKRAKEEPEALAAQLRSVGYWNGTTAKAMLKFTAVIGNPPYQEINQGNGNGADPLYHLFIDLGMTVAEKGTLIHPARFLFKAGKTPKDWNDKILSSNHYKVVDYWAKSDEVFPSVDVKGGIATTYWDLKSDFEPIGTYSAYKELSTILHKVKSKNEISFSTIVGPREAYGLTDVLYQEHPDMEGRQSKGHKYSLSANILEIFPELFTEIESPDSIQIYGRYNNQRGFRWVKDSYISKPDNFEYYKVFVPKANGTGAIGEVLSTPVIGVPVIGHTDTFLSIGKFASAEEASACLKYVKSKLPGVY
ncbi:MAG: Eco57I restriction-modification methylase domain-containing protein [Muribaculum sp.]|nr:Eco57I restriction-modification methylase domain-containing protein [Muribaculum sp.]